MLFKRNKPKPGAVQRLTPEETERSDDVVFTQGRHVMAFELQWQLMQKGQKTKLQSQALATGHTHQVVGVEEDLIGFIKLPKLHQSKSRLYSAALLVSEFASLGGDEIFVFALDETRFGLVALKNSLPVPGFDLIGDEDKIIKAATNYLSLPHKNEVRRCGDPKILSAPEKFDFEALLDRIEGGQPRLRPIPNVRKIFLQGALLMVLVLLAVIGWAGKSYLDAQAEAERLQQENDPNVLYEQSLVTAVAGVRGLGLPMLQAMSGTLLAIPMEIAGWGLAQVDCNTTECLATWSRIHGNFADFDENLPPDVKQAPEYGFISTDSNMQLKTKHPIALEDRGVVKGFKREELPLVPEVQADFVSRLQDYTLIDAKVQVSAPRPFPSSVSSTDAIFKPVVFGTWSVELPLWSLNAMEVPHYVAVESLSVIVKDITSKENKTEQVSLTYKLTGKYYAKGKVY